MSWGPLFCLPHEPPLLVRQTGLFRCHLKHFTDAQSLVPFLQLLGIFPWTRVFLGKEELRVTDQAAALWLPWETRPSPAPPPPVG